MMLLTFYTGLRFFQNVVSYKGSAMNFMTRRVSMWSFTIYLEGKMLSNLVLDFVMELRSTLVLITLYLHFVPPKWMNLNINGESQSSGQVEGLLKNATLQPLKNTEPEKPSYSEINLKKSQYEKRFTSRTNEQHGRCIKNRYHECSWSRNYFPANIPESIPKTFAENDSVIQPCCLPEYWFACRKSLEVCS